MGGRGKIPNILRTAFVNGHMEEGLATKKRNTSVRRCEAAGECRLAIPFPDRTNLTPLIEGSKWESYVCTHLEYQRTRSNRLLLIAGPVESKADTVMKPKRSVPVG